MTKLPPLDDLKDNPLVRLVVSFFIDVNKLFLLLGDKEDTILLITWFSLIGHFVNAVEVWATAFHNDCLHENDVPRVP